MWHMSIVAMLAVVYLMTGLAFVQLTWRDFDRLAGDDGRRYRRLVAIVVLRWPHLVYSLWRRRP